MEIITQNPYRQIGVYANSPKKDQLANENKLKALLKVGKQVPFPLDLEGFLSPIQRTSESVADAQAKLTLPKDQMHYAQFWFVNVTPLDKVAFNKLTSGDMDGAIEIWGRQNNASSLQNRIVCKLIVKDYGAAISFAEKLYSQYKQPFVTAILGDTALVSTDTLAYDFLDTLSGEVGLNTILPSVTNAEWKSHLSSKAIDPLIAQLQSAVETAKAARGKGPDARRKAGEKLMMETKPLIKQLKTLLPTSDIRCQTIIDKVGIEILQCGIDYYNDSEDTDKVHKAMQLQSYALSIVVGEMAKERCNENVDILKRKIASLPPAEVMGEHNAILLALATFATQSDLIKYSIQLIKNCAPHIVAIKGKLGSNHQYYLRISTTIVNKALGNVISEVNKAQTTGDFRILKSVLIAAWRTQLYLDKFDVEPAYKEGRLRECRSALHDIIEQCKGFENSSYSYRYRYGCGWCNNLDVSDLDLRTDDEFFASCQTLASYDEYLQKFPKGKHASEAKSKIIELRYEECETISDYQKFIKDYPQSNYRQKAESKIIEIELRYKKCRTISDYQKFIKDYPRSDYRQKAESKIIELRYEECETISDYQWFLEKYPKSIYQQEALAAIKKLRCEKIYHVIKVACCIGIPILALLYFLFGT